MPHDLIAWQQGRGLLVVIAKARRQKRIGCFEKIAQSDPADKRSPRIAGEFRRAAEHVCESCRAAGGDRENPKPLRMGILVSFVELHFASPAVAGIAGPNRFRPIIDFDVEGEPRFGVRIDFKGGVRIEALLASLEAKAVLTPKVADGNAGPMGANEQMDDRCGKSPAVCLSSDADRPKKTASRRCSVEPMQETVTERTQGVVAQRALAGGGVAPPTHPAGGGEFLQPLLHAPFRRERIDERRAENEKLPNGQRAAIQGLEQIPVPRRDKTERFSCHTREWSLHSSPFFHHTPCLPSKRPSSTWTN